MLSLLLKMAWWLQPLSYLNVFIQLNAGHQLLIPCVKHSVKISFLFWWPCDDTIQALKFYFDNLSNISILIINISLKISQVHVYKIDSKGCEIIQLHAIYVLTYEGWSKIKVNVALTLVIVNIRSLIWHRI